ncbi:hypothetical protein ACN6Q1_21920 [Acinetobacter baumannii]
MGTSSKLQLIPPSNPPPRVGFLLSIKAQKLGCLLYTSDAADD